MAECVERQEKNERTSIKEGMKALWEMLGDRQWYLVRVTVWMGVFQLMMLLFPLITKYVFQKLQTIPEIKTLEDLNAMKGYVFRLIVLMGTSRLIAFALKRFFQEMPYYRNIGAVLKRMSKQLSDKLQSLNGGYHERENTGKKVSKIKRGNEQLMSCVSILHNLLPKIFFLALNIVFILAQDWKLGVVFLFPIIPSALINIYVNWKFNPVWQECEKLYNRADGRFVQSIHCIRTIQCYGQEEKEKRLFAEDFDRAVDLDTQTNIKAQSYYYGINVLVGIFLTLTFYFGTNMVIADPSSVGTVVYILMTTTGTYSSVWEMVNDYTRLSRNLIGVMGVKRILDTQPDIQDSSDAIVPEGYGGKLVLRDVSFRYSGREKPLIDGISLGITPGQMAAFVGRSGEGKSTLFKLISRMYDVDKGTITLDGTDIRHIKYAWYKHLFAFVQQNEDVFDGTLMENITYAREDAPPGQIKEAIKVAHLGPMLANADKFPLGLDTVVGERGIMLSGGERQRVGIARAYLALLNGARILMLDEATSQLDSEAELAVQEMIERVRTRKHITILVIAHRLSTIARADIIHVLNDGRIVEQGSDKALRKKRGLYARFRALQGYQELDISRA